MADFPANRLSSGSSIVGIGCFLILASIALWITGFIMLFHGLATHDGWEAGWGGAIIFTLLVITVINRARK